MPGIEKKTGEQMLIHQFLTGLPTTISQQLRATGKATELDKAVEQARLLMTIHNEPLQGVAVTETSSLPARLMDKTETLTQQVAALTVRKPQYRQGLMRCFNCQGLGHLQRNCTSPP